jgi:hypothetical protein
MRRVVWLALLIFALCVPAPMQAAPAGAAPLPQEIEPVEARVAMIEMSPPARFDDFEEPYPSDFWSDEATDTSERFFDEGAYQIAIYEPQTVAWGLADDLAFENFLAATDASAWAGPLDNQLGIIFRYEDRNNFYIYRISSDGYYSLARLVDGEWESLVSWTASEAIDQEEDAKNLLELLVEDGSIHMLVNGELLDTFEDEDSYEGGIGLMAGAYDEADVQIGFDNFAVWDAGNPTVELLGRLDEIRAAKPLRSDDFEDPDTEAWRSYDTAESSRFLDLGKLHVLVDAEQMVSWIGPEDGEEIGDFLLEVEASQVAGPEDGEYGIIFRNAGDEFYYYKVGSDGFYALDMYVDDDWETLVDWTPADALETGEGATNVLGVLANGSVLTLLANDTPLVTVEDDSLAEGVFALAAGTADEGGVEAVFDDVNVWEITAPEPTPTPTATATVTSTPESLATAMSVPAATPTVEPTATPTATPATAVDADTLVGEIRLTKPDFSDDFRRATSGWGTSEAEDVSVAYADRALVFDIDRQNYLTWTYNDQIDELEPADFLLEVDTEHLEGPTNVGYGLFFAFHDADNYHRLFVSQNGQYSLQKFVDGVGEDLIKWQATPALSTEAQGVNRLGLLIEGAEITVMANDQVLAQVTDPEMTPGRLALMASTAAVPGLQLAFDNLDLWVLKSASELSATPASTSTP